MASRLKEFPSSGSVAVVKESAKKGNLIKEEATAATDRMSRMRDARKEKAEERKKRGYAELEKSD